MAINKTYGKLVYQNGAWYITELESHAVIKLKALFSNIKLTGKAPFIFKDTLDMAMDLEWFCQRYPLVMDNNTFNKLKIKKHAYEQRINSLEKILSNEFIPKAVKLKDGKELRNYQTQAVELVCRNNSLLLGDDLGLGKTVTGIGLILKQASAPSIVVVPIHLANHWLEKIQEFTDLTVHVIEGTKPYPIPHCNVIIIKYSCLSGWFDIFKNLNYNTVIFDEIHNLRRSDSLRYEAAEEIVSYASFKLGLSASPIFNYGDEIFNIIDILNKSALGVKEDFLREWTNNQKMVSNTVALGNYLRDNYLFLRRMKEDVDRELPPVSRITQNIDFDQKEIAKHESLMKQLAVKILDGSTFHEKGVAARELNTMVRKITGISKARNVAEYVKILLLNNRKVILAGWHRDVYDIWLEELRDFNPVLYTGSEGAKQKQDAYKKFVNNDTKILIISLRSGEGIDGFQHSCRDIVFGELDWSPAVHAQLIGRIHRDGQKENVMAHFLVSEAGCDPTMIELLGVKASQAQDIIDPNKEITEEEDPEAVQNRIKLLAQNILQKS